MRPSLLIAIVAVLVLALSSMYRIEESHIGIRFQLGRIVETDIEPGLHFKLPLVQNVMSFDRRILSLDDSRPERYLTSEKKDVNVDFFVKWRIADVQRFFTATSGIEVQARQRLQPIITEVIRNEIAQRTLQAVVSGERKDLAQRFVDVSNQRVRELGIEVVDVRIKRIDLPEDSEVIGSVFQRMRAERLRVANELRAEGQEISETIRSDADRQRQVLVAEAQRDAELIRGEADARAADIYALSYGVDSEFYAFHRSLQAYREAFGRGDSVLVLDRDAEFLRYFEQTPPR